MGRDIVKIIDEKINEIEVLRAKENVIKGIPEVKIRKLLGVIRLPPSTADVNDSFNSVQDNMNTLVSRMNVSFKISSEILDIIKGLNKDYLATILDEERQIKENNKSISQQQVEISTTINVLGNVVQRLNEFRDHVDAQLCEMCGKDWESDVKRQKEMLEQLEYKFNEFNNKFNKIDNEIKELVNPMLSILNQDGGELKTIKENIDELKECYKVSGGAIAHSKDDIKVLKELTDTHNKELDNIHQGYTKLIDDFEKRFNEIAIEDERMRNDLYIINYDFITYGQSTNKEIKNIKKHLIILTITIALTFMFSLVIFILLLCGIF